MLPLPVAAETTATARTPARDARCGVRRSVGRNGIVLRGMLAACLLSTLAGCGGGAGLTARQSARNYAGASHRYPPPGPPEDPWGPYIREAAHRFRVPEQWVRAVMHQESGGHAFLGGAPITSSAGAMGLMQVMPATYDELRAQNSLGDDPFDPHNSILAGTAYIRQMYDRYGSPGFLAAYNAGPQRMDNYLAGSGSLPNETVNYVAAIGPHLGGAMPGGGSAPVMLAAVPARSAYGRGRGSGCVRDPDAAYDSPCGTIARPPDPEPVEVAAAATPRWAAPATPAFAGGSRAGCVRDPDAAYDSPCGSALAPVVVAAVQPTPPGCLRDPDAAYDSPCGTSRPAPVLVAASEPVATAIYSAAPPAYATRPPPQQVAEARAPLRPVFVPPASPGAAMRGDAAGRYAMPALVARADAAPAYAARGATPMRHGEAPAVRVVPALASGGSGRGWGIQVGAFATPELARSTAEGARRAAPQLLGGAQTRVGTTTPFGGAVLYRARLVGMGAQEAAEACARVQRRGTPCLTVAPGA